MKKFLFLFLLSAVSATALHAQTKDEKAVAAAVETLRKAMLDGDRTALQNISSPALSYGHSGGKVEDQAAFVEALASGANDFVTIDLSEQTIQVTGSTAIVRHKLNGTSNDGGKPGVVKIAVMTVWVKQGKDWKLLARQAVKLP